MKINRDRFFLTYRSLFGPLIQEQVDGLNALLDAIELDDKVSDPRHVAYILATTKHETADTFAPIAEYGKGRGRPYGNPDPETGQTYYGRGFVQLTWRRNYEYFSQRLGIDLVNEPDAAMRPDVAYQIMSVGMREGRFTGRRLSDYIHDNVTAYRNARRIINGLDKADLVASYAVKFERILTASIENGVTP